jgi:hypothetical protein
MLVLSRPSFHILDHRLVMQPHNSVFDRFSEVQAREAQQALSTSCPTCIHWPLVHNSRTASRRNYSVYTRFFIGHLLGRKGMTHKVSTKMGDFHSIEKLFQIHFQALS